MRQPSDQPIAQSNQIGFTTAFAALVMGAIAMGISPVFVREAEIGPFASAFWRVAVALPLLYVWARTERYKGSKKPLVYMTTPTLMAGLFFAADLSFWHLAIMNTTMANATLMTCLAPGWVILFSRTFIGEEVSANAVVGLVICIVGAAFLIATSFQIAPHRIVGDIYGVITSLFFGLYFLAMRVARRQLNSGELVFRSSIITAAVLLVVALVSGNQFLPETGKGYAALLSMGIISHAGGQGLLAIALGSLTAVFSSLVIFIEAIAAAFFGWLIFSEELTTGQLLGGVLILSGIWWARPRKKP